MSAVPASAAEKKPSKVALFFELVKFEHSVFALPHAYIGALYGAAWLERQEPLFELPAQVTPFLQLGPLVYKGGGYAWPSWWALFWITVVMVGARAFAFVLNRAIDKEIDARNPRTAGRAIPAGLINAGELWVFSAIVLVAYLFGVWQLAPITHWLWPLPLIAFFVYPYTKRFTPLCHYWLGLCLGLAPVGGWLAVGASIAEPAPWLMGVAVMLWTGGFDIIYATQDVECDVRDGIHSMPADFGVAAALRQTRIVHAVTVLLLVAAGWFADAGWAWYVGVTIAAALLVWENAIVHPDDMSRVNAAFFTVNGVIAVILGVFAVVDRVLA